jgi:L-amino acid N-acyltransferase YncA
MAWPVRGIQTRTDDNVETLFSIERFSGELIRIQDVKYTIDTLHASHWEAVRSIYLEGIATGNATFETDGPDWETWNRNHLSFARLIARSGDGVVGWAALSPVSSRRVYAGVAEVSVYVAASARGMGVGRALLVALIAEAERNGIWTLQAGVFPENTASIALHKSCGFREVGRRERLGMLRAVWRDVILLERRSRTIGIE